MRRQPNAASTLCALNSNANETPPRHEDASFTANKEHSVSPPQVATCISQTVRTPTVSSGPYKRNTGHRSTTYPLRSPPVTTVKQPKNLR